VQLF